MPKGDSNEPHPSSKNNFKYAYHIHTVLELYVLEVPKEVFKQIRVKSPIRCLRGGKYQTTVLTRFSGKGCCVRNTIEIILSNNS